MPDARAHTRPTECSTKWVNLLHDGGLLHHLRHRLLCLNYPHGNLLYDHLLYVLYGQRLHRNLNRHLHLPHLFYDSVTAHTHTMSGADAVGTHPGTAHTPAPHTFRLQKSTCCCICTGGCCGTIAGNSWADRAERNGTCIAHRPSDIYVSCDHKLSFILVDLVWGGVDLRDHRAHGPNGTDVGVSHRVAHADV